jgi:hypothetical protein
LAKDRVSSVANVARCQATWYGHVTGCHLLKLVCVLQRNEWKIQDTGSKSATSTSQLYMSSVDGDFECGLYTFIRPNQQQFILVPRASRPRATSIGPGIHGTESARKLAVVSKAHTLEFSGTL